MKARIRIAAVAATIVIISSAFMLSKEKRTNTVPDPEPGNISFEFCPENSYWLPEAKKDEFYVFVLLKAGEKPVSAETQRTPLNLSLVVDRSGSMEGDKIKYTKQAVDYVINQLGEQDRISIIQYSDGVDVLAATQSIGGPHATAQQSCFHSRHWLYEFERRHGRRIQAGWNFSQETERQWWRQLRASCVCWCRTDSPTRA